MRIIGIDPGTRFCGYGIIETDNRRITAAGCNCININPKLKLSGRLNELYSSLIKVIKEYQPDIAAVESIFYGKNIQSAFTLGHARGVILLACSQFNLPIYEFSPKEIKKAVVGNGNAQKSQVRYMIQKLVGLKEEIKSEDASDALAIAYTQYNRVKFQAMTRLGIENAKET